MKYSRVLVAVSIVIALLALASCTNTDGGSRAAQPDRQAVTEEAEEPATPVTSAPPTRTEEEEHRAAAPAEAAHNHSPGGAQGMPTREQSEAAIAEMRAALAATADASTCEQVYATMEVAHRVIGDAASRPADRDEFLAVCNRLPEQVQRCMVPDVDRVETDHTACIRAHENLEPELAQDLARVSPGGPPPAQ